MPPSEWQESSLYASGLNLEFIYCLDETLTTLPWEFCGIMLMGQAEVDDELPDGADPIVYRLTALISKYASTLSTIDLHIAAINVVNSHVESGYSILTDVPSIVTIWQEIERTCEADEADDVYRLAHSLDQVCDARGLIKELIDEGASGFVNEVT